MTDTAPTPPAVTPSSIPPAGSRLTAKPIDANGLPTTAGVNGAAWVVSDPAGAVAQSPSADGLSVDLVPNAGIVGDVSAVWNATDANGNAILDPGTGAAPAYSGAVVPGNAVSATVEVTDIPAADAAPAT